jgi:hypothetical protein
MNDAAATALGVVTVGVLAVALLRANGRTVIVSMSGSGVLAIIVIAVLLGYGH